MARPLRLLIPGGFYHLTVRGNERRPIYRDRYDRERFLAILEGVVEEASWRVLAYCLMDNHYHLLARTPEPNLAKGMHRLNGAYAQAFNRRHERVGHLFQGRYGAKLVQDDSHLHATACYIVRNPVRAGLCPGPTAWAWSSHRATLGAVQPPPFLAVEDLLRCYGSDLDRARRSYREAAERPDGSDLDRHSLVVGDDDFIRWALARAQPAAGVPRRYFLPPRPVLSSLLTRSSGEAAAIATAHAHGYSLREIARHLGVDASTVSRRLRRHRLQPEGATPGV